MTGLEKETSKKDLVRTYLRKQLNSGKYPPGAMFLSENILTKELGICKNTVREAYSSLVSEGLLERIRGRGTFVLAPQEKEAESNSKQVHLLIGDPIGRHEEDPFIGTILIGLHSILDPQGWNIKLHLLNHLDRIRDELENLLPEMNKNDVILLAGFEYSKEITDRILHAGHRLLTIGKPEDISIPYTHGDNEKLVYDAIKYLLNYGHKKIAFADRRVSHVPSFEERRRGYMRALSEAGIVPDARLMVEYKQFDISAGQEVWEQLSRSGCPFSALLIYGDWATHGAIQCAANSGIRIPEELSLFTICGTPVISAGRMVTRADIGIVNLAKRAAQLLLQKENGKLEETTLLPPQIYPGNSIETYISKEN